MKRGPRLLLGVLALGLPAPALAQPKGGPPVPVAEASAEDQAKAQQHFKRARELYQAGSYREAVTELEAARALDPKAKDLVYNLGIVHEKLAKYDEAIADFRAYLEMEGVTAAERQKAESSIKRIEGAKREVPETPAPTASTTSTPPPPPPHGEPERPEAAPHGRVDAATVIAASLGAIGLGVGVGFGVRALSLRPNDFVTGRDGTYQDLQNRTDDAHTSAIVSDVGFGVGIVGAAAAAWLYFGRTKDTKRATVTPAILPGGGAVLVGGALP
jgi:tetratricopeptide (TPR) repeat protein